MDQADGQSVKLSNRFIACSLDSGIRPVNRKIVKYVHIHKQAFTSLNKNHSPHLIYCILSNGEVIKYHKFISVVVIELSFRCLNTGPEDRLLVVGWVIQWLVSWMGDPIVRLVIDLIFFLYTEWS